MSADLGWLPELLRFEDYSGCWSRYEAALYECFYRDFLASSPTFEGRRVGVKKKPYEKGKEAAFWHLVSAGRCESTRKVDLRRCERIAWPRSMIDAAGTRCVRTWTNNRGREQRAVIALPDFSYAVILALRDGYALLWTAYCVDREHTRRKMMRECAQRGEAEKG